MRDSIVAGGLGHSLCLDGFGAPSQEELKAGYPVHGEASRLHFEIVPSAKGESVSSMTLGARLPLAQECMALIIGMGEGKDVA
jgi:hypothetical protein